MRQKITPFTLCLLLVLAAPVPVFAQDAQAERNEGLSLMERGMRLLFDGLIEEMEPALGEMAEAMKQLEPMARQLAALIGDVRYYEQPERLENGDILIRRKADAPPPPKLPEPDTAPLMDLAPKGQIDL
ncbi:AAA+ family ATPase [Pseudorhodobacter sp.]|uniref:AAA+ family ATPase n=1 Tax=Pseudorhodobacter sp. TaxID=1934400 RepID=UPI002AFEB680|nr:AAA+ family ATPase [Pseudorhodobacter sp.]